MKQTISITKAGIQATLNARASILAAANPIYGRYDRTKTLKANVSLSAPILSRFDLFFVVLDNSDEKSDYHVAKHILDVHRCEEEAIESPFSVQQMQKYIRFAKTINPKLCEESRKLLIQYYRALRQNDAMGRGRTAYRITVRQLESMIRLSEAMARLFCDEIVRPQYVRDAYRLLQKSIIHVESDDVTFEEEEEEEEETEGADLNHIAEGADRSTILNDDKAVHNSDVHDTSNTPADSTLVKDGKHDQALTSTDDRDLRPSKVMERAKKKVKISYEDYDAMKKTITTYLRSKEREDDSTYLTWREVLEWYLEQRESEIGDSEDVLVSMKKLALLVFRRMIQVDRVLIFMSDDEDELNRTIAVHPNFSLA
jgi:DNA replication licensing factor MCM6